MEFKKILKELRISKKLTLRAVSKETGLSFSTIAKWERGESEPSVSAIKVLTKFFDVTAGYLLGLED